jgi:hypothetical protein
VRLLVHARWENDNLWSDMFPKEHFPGVGLEGRAHVAIDSLLRPPSP